MRDLPWTIMAASVCAMLAAFLAPWEHVHLEQETGGPIDEQDWYFAPWGMVADGKPAFLHHAPNGIDDDNRDALSAATVALAGSVALLLVPPLQGGWRAIHLAPVVLSIFAAASWTSQPLRLVCVEAQNGHKQLCDADGYSSPVFFVVAALGFAGAAFLPRPEPQDDSVLPALPDARDEP